MLFVAGIFVGVILGFMIHSNVWIAKREDEIMEINNVKTDIRIEDTKII